MGWPFKSKKAETKPITPKKSLRQMLPYYGAITFIGAAFVFGGILSGGLIGVLLSIAALGFASYGLYRNARSEQMKRQAKQAMEAELKHPNAKDPHDQLIRSSSATLEKQLKTHTKSELVDPYTQAKEVDALLGLNKKNGHEEEGEGEGEGSKRRDDNKDDEHPRLHP